MTYDSDRLHDLITQVRVQLTMERFRNGIAQRDLAESMGTTQSQLAYLEGHARTATKIETLARWAAALGGRLDIRVVWPEDEIEAAAERAYRAIPDGPSWSETSEEVKEHYRKVARAVVGL